MATRFINGGEPNYLGFPFNSEIELLEKIRDEAVLAGWTVENDLIVAQSQMTLSAISGVNAHKCYLVFKIEDNPDITLGKKLALYGDLTGTGASISPTVYTQFIGGQEGRLWAAITESHMGICTVGTDGEYRGIHGGFCDRVDPINDSGAWYIGYISGYIYDNYVARAAHDQEIWRQLNNSNIIRDGGNWASNNKEDGGCMGCMDRYTVGTGKRVSNTNTFSNGSYPNQSPIYLCIYGQVNRGGGSPVLGDYYLPEGRGGIYDYGYKDGSTTFANKLYFRGVIPNLRVGMASLIGGVQVSTGEQRILSVGERTWQGLRIK
jgi:hypothetical protein